MSKVLWGDLSRLALDLAFTRFQASLHILTRFIADLIIVLFQSSTVRPMWHHEVWSTLFLLEGYQVPPTNILSAQLCMSAVRRQLNCLSTASVFFWSVSPHYAHKPTRAPDLIITQSRRPPRPNKWENDRNIWMSTAKENRQMQDELRPFSRLICCFTLPRIV